MNALSNIDLVLDYLESRSDVVDGDYGQPEPNEEMNLSRELQEARDAIVALVAVANSIRVPVMFDDIRRLQSALKPFGG
jgi:hypothetical protein